MPQAALAKGMSRRSVRGEMTTAMIVMMTMLRMTMLMIVMMTLVMTTLMMTMLMIFG